MRKRLSYGTFEQFKNDMREARNAPFLAAVDEIADEMYHVEIQDEFDALWDGSDDDE